MELGEADGTGSTPSSTPNLDAELLGALASGAADEMLDELHRILNNGAHPNARQACCKPCQCIMRASACNDLPRQVRVWCDESYEYITSVPALHVAALCAQPRAVELLLARGADRTAVVSVHMRPQPDVAPSQQGAGGEAERASSDGAKRMYFGVVLNDGDGVLAALDKIRCRAAHNACRRQIEEAL